MPAGGEAGALRDHLHGHVDDLEAGIAHELERRGHEHLTACLSEPRVVDAEARADVAEARGRQQGVADRVADGVAVAVAGEPGLVGPVEAAEPQGPRVVVRVHIDADARAQGGARAAQQLLGPAQIPWSGHLERALVALDGDDGMPGRRVDAGIIGVLGPGRDGRDRRAVLREREALRRLNRGQLRTVDLFEHGSARVAPGDRVDHGERRDDPRALGAHALHHAGEDVGRRQRSRGVVHEHDVGRVVHRGEAGRHRGRAAVAADHHGECIRRRPRDAAADRESLGPVAGGSDDDDLRRLRLVERALEGVLEKRLAREGDEGLRNAEAQPGSAAGGDDDDREARRGRGRGLGHTRTVSVGSLRRRAPRRAPSRPSPRRSSRRERAH